MKEADIPAEYGGQSNRAFYDSAEEVKLLEYVRKIKQSS